MYKKYKHNINKFLSATLGIALAIFASYTLAMSRPANTSTNVTGVLNVGTTDQQKNGYIKTLAFSAGDYKSSTAYNYMSVDNIGAVAIGKSDTPDPSLGISLDIAGTTGILGTMRAKSLESTGTREVCADKDGVLTFCQKELEFLSKDDYKPSYYGVMVPEGVTSMTVEMYGAGGAGYAKDNYKTGADNGQSSSIAGTNISIVAGGGTSADAPSVAGKGGTVVITGSVSSQSTTPGGDGSVPGSFNDSPSQFGNSNTCNGKTYRTIEGATGNTGGNGGKPYGGSNASGGGGGYGAPTSGSNGQQGAWSFNSSSGATNNATDCNYVGQTSDEYVSTDYKNTRPGGDGADGASFGAGGAGFGGKGGLSAVMGQISDCTACYGGNGSAGGGAGAYVKATLSVKAGETFVLKVGNNGTPEFPSCSGFMGVNICLDDLGGGAKSGNGADGYIKITYN